MMQFLVPVFAVITLVVPILMLAWVFKTRAASRIYFLSLILLTVASLIVIRVFGYWPSVGVFWPPVFLIAFLSIVVLRCQSLPEVWFPPMWSREFFLTVFSLVATLALTTILPNIIRAKSYGGEAVSLNFPLRGGVFYVMYGGATSAVNPLHRLTAGRQQQFALDITQLNIAGLRAWGLDPDDLIKYRIFGTEVVAPCDGEVLTSEDSLPNQPIHNMDLKNLTGNHVTIFCGEVTVVLAHLQQGSVLLAEGEYVSTGQLIGQVGNSGATFEPHLHIHAVRGRHPETRGLARQGTTVNDLFEAAEGVPIEFDGRFLIKNDWLTN